MIKEYFNFIDYLEYNNKYLHVVLIITITILILFMLFLAFVKLSIDYPWVLWIAVGMILQPIFNYCANIVRTFKDYKNGDNS